jgi:D-alanyl-D-alanine carboxypeptidase
LFAPGASFCCSDTNYKCSAWIIERIAGRSWRHAVTRRVIRPLRLTRTNLPAPGHRSIKGEHAHGYGELDGKTIDLTRVDPSFAGAAGACALVTTVQNPDRFLNALFKGRLFRHRATLRQMLDLPPAQGDAYELGMERYARAGGLELVGHLGGTAGYRSLTGRVRPVGVTITLALNAQDDPTPLVIPAVQALAKIGGRPAAEH